MDIRNPGKGLTISKIMRWTIEQIKQLSKQVYGNFSDEAVLAMTGELHVHLKKYHESFLGLHNKHEWAEVERLAEQMHTRIRNLPRIIAGFTGNGFGKYRPIH